MKRLTFGDVSVERVVEAEGPGFFPSFLMPASEEAAVRAEGDWLEPHFFDPTSGRFIMSVHSYLVRTPRHTVLIDSCVGNDKERPSTEPWHRMQTPWLDDLKALGVQPEDVDYVLCTHLHVDHVGWNTRLEDGRWVPTFANARYLFHEDEYAFWEAGRTAGPQGFGSGDDCFADSVLPVVEAGLAVLVRGGHEIDGTMVVEETPGHTPGHVCVNLAAGGARAVFTGDLMHHPVQCAYPEWNSRFCVDPERSRASREAFVDRHAVTDTVILAAHFAQPTAGRVAANGGRLKFEVP